MKGARPFGFGVKGRKPRYNQGYALYTGVEGEGEGEGLSLALRGVGGFPLQGEGEGGTRRVRKKVKKKGSAGRPRWCFEEAAAAPAGEGEKRE